MIKKLSLFCAIIGLALVFANKSFAFMQDYNTDKVSVSIMTSYDAINPEQDLDILVRFKPKKGWHIFSETPGEIGLPTKVQWNLPQGFELGNTQWSRDKKFETDGITQYGYDKLAYYKASIKPSRDYRGYADFSGKISWLACKDECVPEKFLFNFRLPITNKDLLPCDNFFEESMSSQKLFMADTSQDTEQQNLIVVLLMAFLGGIILNFMPCIFPILTIKAISLAQGTINKTKSRIEAMIYTAGVVSSFLLIASLLVFLRSQGEEIGWGFQLQSPLFVVIMIVVFFLIFLMLLDIINIRNPFANKVGRISFARRKINAFVTGFFAVLIASPCTAPFMGIAIGYTLSQPIYIYYPVFLALSLGYALPFALVGWFPKAVHKVLPRPGKWMDTLKKVFSIPVFLTCVWLGWVLYGQMDKRPPLQDMEWQPFDNQKVMDLVKNNQPVFIDFTAKWCITCLANKKIALQSNEFIMLAHEKKLNLFRADWTNNDAEVSKALEAYGRNSIPLYIYYDGDGINYKILPQLLTPKILTRELSSED